MRDSGTHACDWRGLRLQTRGEPRYHQLHMAEELWQTLVRFHREVITPDLRTMVDEALDPLRGEIAASRRDNERHFDELYKRLDVIESEIQALRAGVSASKTR